MSRICNWMLALLTLLCCSSPAYALDPDKHFQDYARDNWSAEQGLPQITVLSFAQDAQGYMWIGTQNGLARFDGVQFKNYLPGDADSIPDLWVQALLLDPKGRLWVGTYKGLAWYQAGHFTQVPAATLLPPDIRALAAEPEDDVAVATPSGLLIAHQDKLVPDALLGNLPAYSLLERGGSLWVGSVDKVYRRAGKTVTSLDLPVSEYGTLVEHLIEHDGAIWAATSHGLFRYRDGVWSGFRLPALLEDLPVSALHADSDGTLWVATIGGTARIVHDQIVEVVPPEATSGQVEAIFEDREHDLWFGTRANGMFRLWSGFIERLDTTYGLNDPLVWSVVRGQDDSLWVGTSNGLDHFVNGRFVLAAAGAALPNPNAYTLLVDGDTVWIGTRTGIAVYQHGRVEMPAVFAPLRTVQVSGIIKDSSGDLWFASADGLFRYSGGVLTRYGPEQGLIEVRCRVLHATDEGRLLVGTENGLYVYNKGRLTRVEDVPADMDVTSVGVLDDGTVVVGGLVENALYVHHAGNWARITPAQGLLKNTAFSIQDDGHGYVWIGGQRGLYRMPIHQLEEVADGKLDTVKAEGILSAQGQWPGSQLSHCCNGAGNARVLLDGDRLLYPTREGVMSVNSRKPQFNQVAPTTVVESVEYGGLLHELQPGDSLTLPAKDRDVAIRVTTLSFQYPQGVTQRYRLLGYDDAWKSLTDVNHRTVFYTNLSPGQYTFEAQGANNAGVWSPVNASLSLKVQPLFYETWWFRIGAIVIVGLLVYFLFRFQVRNLRLRQLQLERTIMQHTAELRRANTRLEEASQTDPLTGARNRRYLANQLPADIALFRREFAQPEGHDRRMVFALMDLDNFKQINDTYGHRSGDQALVEFAELLTSMIRQGDYLVRWGGEEFLVILRSVRYNDVAPYAERLWKAVQQYRFATPDDRTLRVTCSLGIAEYPFYLEEPDAFDWESVVMLADRAMYSIKQSGRNGCAIVRPMPGVPASILKQHMEKGHAWLTQQRMLQVHTYRQTPAADAVNT